MTNYFKNLLFNIQYSIFNTLLLIGLVFFSTSCLKSNEMKAEEEKQITNYIEELGLNFQQTDKDIYYYITSYGEGNKISDNDSVTVVCTGINLDNNGEIFIEDNTFSFLVGDKEIMDGWNEAITMYKEH